LGPRDRDSPAARAWDRGGHARPSEHPLKRWQVYRARLLGALITIALFAAIGAAYLLTR
jgi:hypothetical protein